MWQPNRSLVSLRPVEELDVDNILAWVNDKSVVGNLAAFAGKPMTREDELAWVRKVRTSTEERVFTVMDAREGRYLGQVGLHQIFWRSRVARAAAIIATRADHGMGYGSAAIAALLDKAFHELELHKVWLMVFATNEPFADAIRFGRAASALDHGDDPAGDDEDADASASPDTDALEEEAE